MSLPVAECWFEHRSLADGVTHIWEPYVKPFYRCNIWYVRGRDRDLLIDTGMGVVSLRKAIRHLVKKPLLVLASHTHYDHVGSHHEFTDRAVHAAEADVMAAPSRENTLADRYVKDDILTALPYDGFSAAEYTVEPAPATLVLEAGNVIDLGDRVFEVLHLPGHSPGSIGLWERATGILFSGDAVYDGPLIDDCYHSNVEHYVATMERLRNLAVRVVHGGHFSSFGRARLLELIDEYLAGKRAPGCPSDIVTAGR